MSAGRGRSRGSGFSIPACLAAALTLLAPALAGAQEKKVRRLELGGFIGALSVDHDLGTATSLFFSVSGRGDNVDFGKFYGFRASLHFTPMIAAEGSLIFSENTFSATVEDRDLGAVSVGEQFTADHLGVSGNLIVQVPLARGLTPYGTAGFSAIRLKPQNAIVGLEEVRSSGPNVGGGVKWYFSRWAGARLDVRYHFLSDELAFPGISSSPRNTEFTVGGMVRLF